MSFFLRYLFLPLVFIVSFSFTSRATHLAGGDLVVTHIGNDSFRVTLNYYYDCSSSFNPPMNTRPVRLTSSCTTPQNLTLNITNVGGTEISQICPSQLSNSQCNGGSLPGMRRYTFETVVHLPLDCSDYKFEFSEANRNGSINVTGSIGARFYIDATLNTLAFPGNSTPRFTAQPIPYVCLSQTVNYNYGVVENDGDSLSYALVAARTNTGAGSAVTNMFYNTGYSATAPITGITINSSTGELSFSPTTPTGNYIVTLTVTEYNGVGAVISTVQRDIQFVVINCSNQIPTVPASITNFSGTADSTGVTTITAEVGENFCFDLVFTDVNPTDILILSSNVAAALPGATFNQTGSNPATATICWTVPAGMNTNNTFLVTALDTACPVSGSNSIAIQVIVPPPANLGGVLTTTPISCNGVCDATASVVASGGVGPYTYTWSPTPPPITGQGTSNVTNLCPGAYVLTVKDLGDPDPSTNLWVKPFVIAPVSPIVIVNVQKVDDNCDPAICTGIIQVSAVAGSGSFSYAWSDGPSTSSLRTGLCAGVYTVTATDANSCTKTSTYRILEPAPITASYDTSRNVTCFGGSDGMAVVEVDQSCGVSVNGCTSPVLAQIGNGTGLNQPNAYPTPYGGANFGVRNQFIYRASELQAVGMKAGPITSIGFDVASVGLVGALSDFEVKMGCVTVNDLSGGWVTNLTSLKTYNSHTVLNGWNTHVLDAKFMWDGTSNIVVELCYNNTTSQLSGNSRVRHTPTAFTSVRYFADDNNSVCSSTQTTATSVNRPNTRFQHCENTYTYSWSSPASGQDTANNIPAGNYTVTVSNADGCTDTATFTITQPPQLQPQITPNQQIQCNGDCNGQLTASSTGGVPPYTFLWDNGSSALTRTNLCAGTYTVTVTDSRNCTRSVSYTLVQPTPVVASIALTQGISCNGVCDGQLTASATGGTPGYTYLWSTTATTPGIASLCAGNYSVIVTDANGCKDTTAFTLTQPTALDGTVSQTTAILCNGVCSGVATAAGSGGTGPYTYAWSNGDVGTMADSLCAGVVTVTITDANNCTVTRQTTFTEPPAIVLGLTQTAQILCNGDCTGTVTANASGGTGAITISWPGGGTGTNLCAGTYVVTATDANACTQTASITLTEPSAINTTIAATTPLACNGDCNGVLAATVNGGTPGYTYLWSTTATTPSISNLCAGNYSVIVTDANNCRDTTTFNLTEPPALTVTINQTAQIQCNSVCIAQLVASGSGGVGPYTYAWPGGVNNDTISNLCAGSYTVTITDANGCTSTASHTVTQPPALIANLLITSNILCANDSTGAILLTALGGVSPYSATCTGASCPSPMPAFSGNTLALSNLPAGTYQFVISDANGCTSNQNVTLTEPSPINGTVATTVASCNGVCDGTATLTVSGGTPGYTIAWPGGGSGLTKNGLCAGNHAVTVTDANNCVDTFQFTITEPAPINISINVDTALACNGDCNGQLTATPSGGGGPYTYAWSGGGSSATKGSLCAGTYTVTVTDASGCTAAQSHTLTEPAPINVTITVLDTIQCNGACTGRVQAAATGGAGPYTFAWSNGDIGTIADSLCPGVVTVTVTDANNCTATSNVTLSNPAPFLVGILSSTNVNCNGGNDGTATAALTTGSPANKIFTWAPTPGGGQGTANATGLSAGVYNVTATDTITGCFAVTQVTITEPPVLDVTLAITSAISCGNVCDGQLTATATGGTPGYTFSWNTGPNGAIRSNLCAGTYTVTVTDANGCQDSATINLTQPTPVTATVAINNHVSCNGVCDGSATITPAGGTPGYTIAWPGGPNNAPTKSTLCAGTHVVTVTDANNCATTVNVVITEPSALSLSLTIDNQPLCNGICNGQVSATASGGTAGYTISWPTGPNGPVNNTLCAGTHTVTVTDANNCTATAQVTLVDPPALNVTLAQSSAITCFDSCNGAINSTITGGVPPISIQWSTTATTPNISNLCAGTYTITVTDANNCSDTAQLTIGQPTQITPTINVQTATCGVCDGQINIAPVSGGTGSYTYNWSVTPNPGSVTSVTGLCAGSYTVTITDASGCSVVSSIPVSNTNGPTGASFNVTNVNCYGDCNGAISVTPQGGATPYKYLWSTGNVADTTNSLSNKCAGIYTVTITDASNCLLIVSDTIKQPDSISNAINITHATCAGACTGGITLNTSGGTAGYSYLWNDNNTSGTRANLCAGTYTVTTTDANNCTRVDIVTVNDGATITVNVTGNNTTCNNNCDGSATAVPSGGQANYTFKWSNNDVTSTVSDLCAGNYTVTVTDANGCTGVGNVTIGSPPAISIDNVIATQPACGQNNGSLQAVVSGGTGMLTVTWNGNAANPATNLGAAIYTLVVTDANGCSVTQQVPLSNIGAPTISVANTPAGCSGSCNGTATVTVPTTGGPFGITWNTTATTPTISNLCAGGYGVTVTDNSTGCIAVDTTTVIEIPGPVVTLKKSDNSNCGGSCTGKIIAVVTSATPPLTYAWDNGITDTDSIVDSLCAGTYNVTVTDANGCSTTIGATIVDVPSLTLKIDSVNKTSCPNSNDGFIQISTTGGAAPMTYSWTGPGFTSSSEDITNLLPGQYIVVVTDQGGCTAKDTINLESKSKLGINPTDSAICDVVDSVTLFANATGIINPVYNWVPGNGGPTVGTDSSLKVPFNLGDTIRYIVFVTDNGCVVSDTATIKSNLVKGVDAGLTKSIVKGESVKIGGSPTVPYVVQSITWDPALGLDDGTKANPIASPEVTTFYTVKVVDLIGCSGTDTVTVYVSDKFNFASGFSPNRDGVNDTWKLNFLERFPDSQVQIFNRWGQLVFTSTKGYKTPWDGTFNGSDLPIGTYYYIIDLGNDDITKPLTGPVTIMR